MCASLVLQCLRFCYNVAAPSSRVHESPGTNQIRLKTQTDSYLRRLRLIKVATARPVSQGEAALKGTRILVV
jgi:hypothetical protein